MTGGSLPSFGKASRSFTFSSPTWAALWIASSRMVDHLALLDEDEFFLHVELHLALDDDHGFFFIVRVVGHEGSGGLLDLEYTIVALGQSGDDLLLLGFALVRCGDVF